LKSETGSANTRPKKRWTNFSVLSAGYDEIRRVIREEEPPKPSTRVTEAVSKAKKSALRPPDSAIAKSWIGS